MKVFTERDRIRGVADRFEKSYKSKMGTAWRFFDGKSPDGILFALRCLDLETASADEVEAILCGWLTVTCDDCGRTARDFVEMGQEPDWESNTATVCFDCVRKAAKEVWLSS